MRHKLNRFLIAILALAWLCASPSAGRAQSASESRAFNAAVEEFEDALFPQAEKDLAEFVRTFPASTLVSEAVLYQGRAALEQQKYKVAIDLLKTNAATATVLGDQYRYWLADAFLQSSNYSAAQNTFAALIKQFPDSNLLLEASYGEALALFRQREWSRTIALLRDPNGTFRKEARLRSANEFAMRGALLLSEALLEEKQFEPAEQGLERLLEADLTPALKWRRQYLLCRIQESVQRLSEALANTTNLLALATASGERNLLAESIDLQGEVLERLDRLSEATQVYESNLAENVPPERARQALLKIAGLTLVQDKTAEAAAKLETFLVRRPEDAASDVVLLTSGELHLKLHFMGASQTNRTDAVTNALSLATNHLDQALANFERVLTNRPPSPLAGRAQLDKGWCLWAGGKIPESQAAFKAAAEMLPHSQEQALARFKLAESQFAQKDFTNALVNFRAVLNGFGDLPRVKEGLFDLALFQIVRSSLELGDLAPAEEAMRQILANYPGSFFSDRSMLLVGQHLTTQKRPADARRVFEDLLDRFPNSTLAPEIDLAVARTFVQEKNWSTAIRKYEAWLERYEENDLRPRAEFNRAWATAQSGEGTNALILFTNFVARFPSNELAPRAQHWVASFYYNLNDFVSAEENFQHPVLLQNTNYSYQALMMALRSAFARQGYNNVEKYFKPLIEDNNCPPQIKVEAYFAYGDTLVSQASDPGKAQDKWADAIVAFKKIPSLYPTNPLVPRAWGRVADCYRQLGTPEGYENATNFYQAVLTNAADVAARSMAEFGLGDTLEAMAKSALAATDLAPLLDAAFNHYTTVFYEKNLRDGETADPFWIEKSGLAASKLAEARKQWEVAINLYSRLLTKLPPLRELLEARINRAREQWQVEKN